MTDGLCSCESRLDRVRGQSPALVNTDNDSAVGLSKQAGENPTKKKRLRCRFMVKVLKFIKIAKTGEKNKIYSVIYEEIHSKNMFFLHFINSNIP